MISLEDFHVYYFHPDNVYNHSPIEEMFENKNVLSLVMSGVLLGAFVSGFHPITLETVAHSHLYTAFNPGDLAVIKK